VSESIWLRASISSRRLASSAERTFNEVRDKLAENERREVEQALEQARQALAGNDAARMRQAQDLLQRATRTLASAALASAASREPAAGHAERPRQDEVIDAEVVDDR
jgi:molecular chaperone DnaK